MEDLDPEEARAIVDPALKLMIDAVHRYDGYIVQSTGDGIFALFGAPVAHEDHPQRALYAGAADAGRVAALLDATGRRGRYRRSQAASASTPAKSWCARSRPATGTLEYTPIGHTTNLASRMQALAPIGSIAVSEATRKLCEGYFALRPLGPTESKASANRSMSTR